MFATSTRFTVPAGAEWESIGRELVRRAFHTWEHANGLRSATLVVVPAHREFGGNHVWDTQEDAETFFRSPAWQRVVEKYGEPRIERAEIRAFIERGSIIYPTDFDERLAGASASID
ncbi:MAG TPA: hypothetical protein VFK85_01285 [Anaeromyxobacteraceae bacterium]|nr:hypothetical protein [Anaeromyxobacteraceae bacterium]